MTHSIQFQEMIGYTLLLFVLLVSPNMISAINFKTACELLRLPRDCHCQRTRGVPISSLNETRLRCRQMTRITTEHRWSIVPYDRLAFETPTDNLTIHSFAFAGIRARTVRLHVQNLFLNDHAFHNAYLGQLAISHMDTYGTLNFQANGEVFYGTTITNIYIKLIDFQVPISEIIFSNAKIYTFIIQASKFYGFTNKVFRPNPKSEANVPVENEHENFLEYDFMSTASSSYQTSSQPPSLKIRRQKKTKMSHLPLEFSDESSSQLPERTVTMNITSNNLPAFIRLYTILSSINTTNLTETYFPNNVEYSQTDEIELSYNSITSINAYAFRHLQNFEGRLILTYNRIQYLSLYAFANLYSLSNLSLANNLIRQLSSRHFQSLNQLYELDLSFNRIEQLASQTFRPLVNLHVLRLNNNPLKSIDADVFANLTHLKEINLQGTQLIQNLDPLHSHWIWNLANLHVNYLLNTNFDLSDVAFCLLSRANQTVSHLSRPYSCSCNVHYLYHKSDTDEETNNDVYPTTMYHSNYLRLTPVCTLNESGAMWEQYPNEHKPTDFVLRGLDEKCDYRLMFLDCDAMTTTTTTTTTTAPPPTTTTTTAATTVSDILSTSELLVSSTAELITVTTTTPWYFKYTKPPKTSINNARKLFTVLGTLIAITVAAIILVILWYRVKAFYKRKQKTKKIIEQQKPFSSPSNNHHHSTAPRYASSDMLGSIHSGQFIGNKSQSQALIAPSTPTAVVYKNIDATASNEPVQNFVAEEYQRQPQSSSQINDQTTDIEATTEC